MHPGLLSTSHFDRDAGVATPLQNSAEKLDLKFQAAQAPGLRYPVLPVSAEVTLHKQGVSPQAHRPTCVFVATTLP